MTAGEGRLDRTSDADFAFLLDDVDLREAQIFQNDPVDRTQSLLNSTDVDLAVDLAGNTYCELDDLHRSGVVNHAAR
jgi:hypothetical protein